MKFSENLQRLRKEKGLSQESLAEQLDVTRQSVSKWESGASYPEMDKLLTLCKIFDCDLDSLLTGEIHKEKERVSKEKESTGKVLFQKFDQMMKKIIFLFESMSAKDFIKFLVELAMIFFIILLFHIPFSLLEDALSSFFYRFGNLSFLSSLFRFFIELAYGILAVISFLYAIKIKYIDKVDDRKRMTEEIPKEAILKEELEENQKSGEVVRKIYVEKKGKTISDFLATMILYFFKFLVFLFLFGTGVGLLCLVVFFGISVSLLIEGLPVLGVSIGVLGAILLVFSILEPAVNFLLNHKNSLKRLFVTFSFSLLFLAIGTTLFTHDWMQITYVDEVTPQYEKKLERKEFVMTEKMNVCYLPHPVLSYEVDESLSNLVQVEYTYYGNQKINFQQTDQGKLYMIREEEKVNFQELLRKVKKDLEKKHLYNYNTYDSLEILIRTNSNNLEKIKENSKSCF